MRHALWSLALVLFVAGAATAAPVRPLEDRLTPWLYETARQMPSGRGEEALPDYLARLETMSRALSLEVSEFATGRGWTARELALAGLVLWQAESGFDVRIHAGTGHPVLHEDHGRARCLGQVHSSRLVPQAEWLELPGTTLEGTRHCARATLLILSRQASQCGVWAGQRASEASLAKTYAAYGTGGNCTPSVEARSRAAEWQHRIAASPEASPLRGYRRALPSEVPACVWERALGAAAPWQIEREDAWAFQRTPAGAVHLFVALSPP